jgi:hypothetical protein
LSLLEEAAEDGEQFRAFCQRFRAEHPEAGDPAFGQWFLEPAEPDGGFQFLDSGWAMGEDPFRTEHGWEIHAACGQELRAPNLSAPRVLRPVRGDFAVQVVSSPVSRAKPTRGGIALWKDGQNCLRLERGLECPREITFAGRRRTGNRFHPVLGGRGRLPDERVFFRLERRRHRVTALCSADGRNWLRVGYIDFPVEDPLEVGLFASATSHFPAIYRAVYPDGTAIRFESFQLWLDPE